jgi:hypothetical protein
MMANGNGNGGAPEVAPTENLSLIVPQPHGGAIRRGSRKGDGTNTSSPGRPKSKLRAMLREILFLSVNEQERRLRALKDGIGVPDRKELRGKSKEELIELIEKGAFGSPITHTDLARIIDVAARYGLGAPNIANIDVDEDGRVTGVVLLPAVRPRGRAIDADVVE